MEFESDVSTQRSVGLFARDVLTKNEETKTELSISDFRFGLDSKPENTIDIFEKIVWTGSAAPLIKPLSNLVNGAENEEPVHSTGNTTTEASGIDFIVKDITVDVVETNTLQTDVDIQFFGFPTSPLTGGNYDLMVDLPYLSLALIWNDNLMLSTEIRNLKFARGALKTSIMAKFAENPAVHQSAFDVIGDLAFRRTRTVTDQAGGASLGFGSSFEKRVQTFQLIKLSKPIEKYVRKISDYNIKNNILYIDDLQNILMEQGIYAETRLSLGKKHLNMKAKIEAAATYQKDGKGPEAKLVDLQIVSIGAPTKLVMKPDLSKTGTAAGLGMVLEKLLSWKDFGSFAKVGYLKMTGSRGHKLNVFETASFPACPISMWDPIHADVLLIDPTAKLAAQEKSLGNPTAVGKAESFMIPIDAFISFRNAGPLHMDLGELAVEIKLDGKTLVKSKSFKNIVFRNKNEGADIPEPFINQGRFYTEIAADDLSLDAIKATIHKLVENKDKLDIIFQLKRDGVPIGYVGEILHQLLDSPALGDVGPLLGGVLAHIVATLLSEVPADAPSWPELNSSINKWMKSNFPNVRKLELPTNQSPSSFPVDLNGLFVHTSSKVVLESPQFKLVAH